MRTRVGGCSLVRAVRVEPVAAAMTLAWNGSNSVIAPDRDKVMQKNWEHI